jgi:hypothetical protein
VQKLANMTPPIGANVGTEDTLTSPNFEKSPTGSGPQMAAAILVTERLFGWCQMPDVSDGKIYLAGVTGILAEYPIEVMNKLADPRIGSRYLWNLPTIPQIRRACEEIYAPIRREFERRQASEDARRSLPPPRRPRTQEEQARIDAQVAAWRNSAGVPDSDLPRRSKQAPMLSPVSRERMAAVAADCEARRIRKQVLAENQRSNTSGEHDG